MTSRRIGSGSAALPWRARHDAADPGAVSGNPSATDGERETRPGSGGSAGHGRGRGRASRGAAPGDERTVRPDRRLTPYLLIAPALALFAFAVLGPIVVTFGFSFVEWPGFGDMSFAGLENYARAFRDEIYLSSFRHAAIYIGLTIVLEVAAGLVMAGIVTSRRGMGWFRVAFFTPVMLPMVVIAVLWAFVLNPDIGMINSGLRAVGLDNLALIWLGDTRTALLAISVVSGWIFAGFYMAIFYAAFAQIPAEIIEAARIDGAGEWRIFLGINVPVIRNTIEVALLLCVTGGFQAFDLFYVMTGGGPYHSTEIPTTYLVRVVFRNHEVGYGSALAVIMTVVVLLIGLLFIRLRSRAGRFGAVGPGTTS